MKKIVAGILILALVLGLVACGGGGNNDPQPTPEPTANVGNDTNLTRVENEEITLMISGNERTGTYSGEVLDGVPHGEGVFTTYNAQGVRWTYTGRFVDGLFHGNGMTEWETGRREEGYYQYGYLFSGRIYDEDGDLLLGMENGEPVHQAGAEFLEGLWQLVYFDDNPSAEFIELASSFSAIRDNPDAHDEFRERMPDMGFNIFLTNAFLDGSISVRELLSAIDYSYLFLSDGTGMVYVDGYEYATLTWSAENGILTLSVGGRAPEVMSFFITDSDYHPISRLVLDSGGWIDEFVWIPLAR